jgi:hypothetical protein
VREAKPNNLVGAAGKAAPLLLRQGASCSAAKSQTNNAGVYREFEAYPGRVFAPHSASGEAHLNSAALPHPANYAAGDPKVVSDHYGTSQPTCERGIMNEHGVPFSAASINAMLMR